MDSVYLEFKTKAPVLKFINTHQPFALHEQFKKTCLDLTGPLPENELNEPVPDVNELIILSEFVQFFALRQTISYLKTFVIAVGTIL